MNTKRNKTRKRIAVTVGILSIILSILLIIVGIQFDSIVIMICILIPVDIILGLCIFFYIKYLYKNMYQLTVKDIINGFKYDYYYGSSLKKCVYNLSNEEFLSTKFIDKEEIIETSNLVVGDRILVDFRSVDVKCNSFAGRVYALNLKADKNYILLANKVNIDGLTKVENCKDVVFYTNDINKTSQIFKSNSLDKIDKLFNNYDKKLIFSIVNGSLYVGKYTTDKYEEIAKDEKKIAEVLVDENKFIEEIIDCFRFEKAKPKIKELVIK